jgi:hypothetical protein
VKEEINANAIARESFDFILKDFLDCLKKVLPTNAELIGPIGRA